MSKNILKTTATTAVCALTLAAAGTASAEVSVYGFARGKIAYDISEDLGGARFAVHSAVQGDNADVLEGHFDFTGVESRFGLRFSEGAVKGNIEGDFASGGRFRLRHGYGTYNNLLVGQTWTNGTTFVAYAPSVDTLGLPGSAGSVGRVAQVRYTMGDFSVAAEDGSGLAIDGADQHVSSPRFTARYESQFAGARFAVGGAFQNIEAAATGTTDTETETGSAFFGAASYSLFGATLRANYGMADGLTDYVYLSPAARDAVYTPATGGITPTAASLETVEVTGGNFSVSYKFGPGSLTAGYGFAEVDDAANAAGGREQINTALLNYFFSPVKNVNYGVELARYGVDDVDGSNRDANRLAFQAQYSF